MLQIASQPLAGLFVLNRLKIEVLLKPDLDGN